MSFLALLHDIAARDPMVITFNWFLSRPKTRPVVVDTQPTPYFNRRQYHLDRADDLEESMRLILAGEDVGITMEQAKNLSAMHRMAARAIEQESRS